MIDIEFKKKTNKAWLNLVIENFDEFLVDHAANERKAAMMAMSMVAHYPDRISLAETMIDLALEELNHFRQVVKIINQRKLAIPSDSKDPYVGNLRSHFKTGSKSYLLDRLLCGAIIEARGAERFLMIAEALPDKKIAKFYLSLAQSEEKHHRLFLDQATNFFDDTTIKTRLHEWLAIESDIIDLLPTLPRLH
ncbi:MAG: tRNA-(ms[2]io[6]A)-hydroxylase [Gammaproteobacteria bacterium]|uniref:tRNA-(Ms[2]io[6]A)-hydroxylase n=1 Tax=OM182 bacterium TaxID=2510334 RepID=A0A520S4Q4_9GAMM|nr:tRNA-(ms[2]io[6]A)-hydroxylase [Gammaproteobacteria bacterium]OUV68284.1 MAG: hypothetical protein CBC93_02855 [Gammaproteobacteria bacterium TMED133]RZO77458.1 MAG: tRNA-(ms[2]io[6]A)-hydroxylase [OM182 bacterium]